jgi:CspA family cold shock protein
MEMDETMEDRVSGTVKWFSARKGYGFISRPGEPDVFVHYSQITADGFRLLEDGQSVEFTLSDGDRGRHARDVVTVKEG